MTTDPNSNQSTSTSTTEEKQPTTIDKVYNVEFEEKLLKRFLDVTFAPTDATWSTYNTKDERIVVDYKFLETDSLCTIRGKMDVKDLSVDEYYRLSECGNQDFYDFEKSCDGMCTESTPVHSIDSNHDLAYGSFDSGVIVIAPRDFCYIRGRHKLDGYKASDGRTYNLCTTLGYSVDKHRFYRETKKGHVRGILEMGGYVVYEEVDEAVDPNANNNDQKSQKSDEKTAHAAYIVKLDPAGWIPVWVVNLVAPEQGMSIKQFHDKWPTVTAIMQARARQENADEPESDATKNDNDNVEEVKVVVDVEEVEVEVEVDGKVETAQVEKADEVEVQEEVTGIVDPQDVAAESESKQTTVNDVVEAQEEATGIVEQHDDVVEVQEEVTNIVEAQDVPDVAEVDNNVEVQTEEAVTDAVEPQDDVDVDDEAEVQVAEAELPEQPEAESK